MPVNNGLVNHGLGRAFGNLGCLCVVRDLGRHNRAEMALI